MKTKALWIGLMIVLSGLPCAAAQIEDKSWADLPIFIVGHEIALVLPDGESVHGKVMAVRADVLEMEIQKTSDKRLHPKGKTTIPKASVSLIELVTKKNSNNSVSAQVVGGAGTLGGLTTGGYLGGKTRTAGGTVVGVTAGGVLGAMGGVMLGRKLDSRKESTFIRVVPENASSPTGPTPRR